MQGGMRKSRFSINILIIIIIIITGRSARSHAGIVFTHRPKNGFFAPQGRHVAPINVKVGTGELSPVPTFTFIGAKMWEYSPQNCQKFEFWPEICTSGATRLQYFYEILSVCTRL